MSKAHCKSFGSSKGAASIDGVAVFVPQTEQEVAVHVEEFREVDDHRRDRLRLGQFPFCDREKRSFHAAVKRPPYFTFARQRRHSTASTALSCESRQ